MAQNNVEALQLMPEIKAEKLIREHQQMRTALENIYIIAKAEASFSDIRRIRDIAANAQQGIK